MAEQLGGLLSTVSFGSSGITNRRAQGKTISALETVEEIVVEMEASVASLGLLEINDDAIEPDFRSVRLEEFAELLSVGERGFKTVRIPPIANPLRAILVASIWVDSEVPGRTLLRNSLTNIESVEICHMADP